MGCFDDQVAVGVLPFFSFTAQVSFGSAVFSSAFLNSLSSLYSFAQCTEAEFYIVATFPGIKRMVLVGDPRQLNSTVLDKDCKAMEYGESMLEA